MPRAASPVRHAAADSQPAWASKATRHLNTAKVDHEAWTEMSNINAPLWGYGLVGEDPKRFAGAGDPKWGEPAAINSGGVTWCQDRFVVNRPGYRIILVLPEWSHP